MSAVADATLWTLPPMSGLIAHLALLGKGIPIVEGLSLKDVEPGDYDLIVLLLRVVDHEAAPARAILRRR